MNTIWKEIALAFILLILLGVFLNPWDILMPTKAAMMFTAIFLVAFALFAALLWRERAADEREEFHFMRADRAAFIVGAGTLVLALSWEVFTHSISTGVIAALAAMILTKLAVLSYSRLHN